MDGKEAILLLYWLLNCISDVLLQFCSLLQYLLLLFYFKRQNIARYNAIMVCIPFIFLPCYITISFISQTQSSIWQTKITRIPISNSSLFPFIFFFFSRNSNPPSLVLLQFLIHPGTRKKKAGFFRLLIIKLAPREPIPSTASQEIGVINPPTSSGFWIHPK